MEKSVMLTTGEVLDQLIVMSQTMDREQFCSVFYGLKPDQDVSYMNEKWGYYQRNGIVYAYNNLDARNGRRVCEFIEHHIVHG